MRMRECEYGLFEEKFALYSSGIGDPLSGGAGARARRAAASLATFSLFVAPPDDENRRYIRCTAEMRAAPPPRNRDESQGSGSLASLKIIPMLLRYNEIVSREGQV
jgi:hypothetical protein